MLNPVSMKSSRLHIGNEREKGLVAMQQDIVTPHLSTNDGEVKADPRKQVQAFSGAFTLHEEKQVQP